jgi:hypothetical protein
MLAAFLLLALGMPAQAAPSYRAEPASVALGEPVALNITARAGLLETLDIAPLEKDFEVRDRSQGGDGKEASLSLTLYPLRTGRIALPSFGLGMRAPTINVAGQSDSVPKVRFLAETEPRQYHVREPVRLTLEACDDGSLMWQRPQLATQEGLFLRALNEEQLEVERDGERCTAHRWHWSVLPTAAGETPLPLPMLEAGKFGQRLRFPPPQIVLTALPVPNWLPLDAAVGRPEISASLLPGQWPINRPLAWHMEVRGSYSAEALKNLLRLQLANLPQFSDYPPVVEELGSDGGVPRHAVKLYAVFRERGEMRLPDLVLPWYDTASGRLQQAQLQGPGLQIVDPARQRLFAWLLALAGLSAALALGYLLWRLLAWRLRRYRALADLKRAADPSGLARRLCAFSLCGRSSPAATLGEWQQRMQQETETEGLAELVAAVEAARYGEVETEFRRLLDTAVGCLATARPRSLRAGRMLRA